MTMKRHLLIAFCLALFAAPLAQAETFEVPLPRVDDPAEVTPRPTLPGLDGSIPEAIRSGQPLQLINPLAPAEFGSGAENVSRAPDDGRPQGFILFGFLF